MIVITRNRYELLRRVIESIELQVVKPKEVIVVDGSDSPKKPIFSSSVPVRYFVDKKKSIPYARNLGVQSSKGDIIVFVDDDCTLYPDAIQRFINHFRSFSAAQAVVGKIENGTGDNVYACVQQYYYERWLKSFGLSFRAIQKIPDGCLMDFELLAIRRSVLMKYLFDDTLPFGRDEDVEIGVRIFRDTQDIYFNPFIRANHVPSQTFVALAKRNIIMGYTNAYLMRNKRVDTKSHVAKRCDDKTVNGARPLLSPLTSIEYRVLLVIYPVFSRFGRCIFVLRDIFSKHI